MDNYLSVKEFAKRIGKSEETVKRKLRNNTYPGAYKKSDKLGWQIPERYLNSSDQEKILTVPLEESLAHLSPSASNIERIIILAYQIAFLCEPSESILHRLKSCGLERALEIILTMRQSPNPIKNPEGFIQKAVVLGWKPNTLLEKRTKQKIQNTDENTMKSNKPKIFLYDWLND